MNFNSIINKLTYNKSLVFIIFLSLLASRRWQQAVSPQVWNEDGTQILPSFLNNGIEAFLVPVNGYLITISKIISFISLKTSILYYPAISTAITFLFIALIGMAVTFSPTKLENKFLCALSIFIIPSDPEVFGLPLYSFWWASILLFLITLWDAKNTSPGMRIIYLLLGGLSSPLIILIIPILHIRAYIYQSKSESIIAFVATTIAIIQSFLIISTSAGSTPSLIALATNIVPTFFGGFLIGNWLHNRIVLFFIGISLLIIIIIFTVRNWRNFSAWILLYLLAGSIALSVARVDPSAIHQTLAGPRYFFFPFILFCWILLQFISSTKSNVFRLLAGTLLLAAIINSFPSWTRQHADMHWKEHIISCRFFPSYSIPIQGDGNQSSAWFVQIEGHKCNDLLNSDIFLTPGNKKTYPYTVYKASSSNKNSFEHIATSKNIISNGWSGSDYYSVASGKKTLEENFKIIGSFQHSDAEKGELTLRLNRDDKIWFRSEPASKKQSIIIDNFETEFMRTLPMTSEWALLEFSNSLLPDQFTVKFIDDGGGSGEWSAIAVANN